MVAGERRVEGGDEKCPADSKSQPGRKCGNKAGAGTDHLGYGPCRYHGGNAPGQRRNEARRMAANASVEIALAEAKDMDPVAGLLWAVRLSAGAVEWYRRQAESDYGFPEYMKEQHDADSGKKHARKALWIQLYGEERDRFVRTCKAAIDAGIAERLVQLEEQQGLFVAAAFTKAMARLNLNATQLAQAPQILREELLRLPAPSARTPLAVASERRA